MRERPVVIGEQPRLVAMLTEAAPESGSEGRPTCVLLNAGLVHRVGPNRLHVRLARALAGLGYRTLRLDLSSRGDSDARRDTLSFLDSSVVEIQAAMDVLERSGSRGFVLVGICSGAVNAIHLARMDTRVAGSVAIDGPAYPTPGYYLRYYSRRLWNWETWWNTLTGRNRIGRLLRGRRGPDSAPARVEDEFGNPWGDARLPSREEAAVLLKGILSRGTRLLWIFTGSWSAYNYQGQFADAFPFTRQSDLVQVEHFPRADHTFTRLYNQRQLVGAICEWATRNWPQTAGTAAPESDERSTVTL